ncbi:endonuclease [Candidatus Kaiserbacteria bacterium RIFCSPHIGHO2_02_FULL_55_25]|uniref:Endonuclease n=1 Tax=Candidatus Kaiserbacteria bacterium RIFCSPHIGHO2_02_FULL_55_25 TaxID=1798498 RepID=A0A1F6EAV9_9BACT|nr:MAG: endonuclease [Candidatus Kaiserbacteria bacterium RIFCSPHIGHO2_01_FULL_55_79]OGG70805.1 MAG: endonuclease [Candidatus Kaiserbacteria bacterium RIFCSPHIGHO2_02_FULL_55_25]OGG77148.1 MAG: endonuclease [Candidatus Kaiserbacteria bacterium RIFCSPHIGHO2_12_FULL_55_13]OGG83402.1 MAG: endonuclease [Candidatus Kaiserbacteria bacterium RIFCSPLOWO2_01_FULL_55_25]
MYFVYLLQCGDGTLYTGVTTDLKRRLLEHKKGTGGNYTRAHGAKRIVYSEQSRDRSAAQKREAAIKKLSRGKKLKLVRLW